MQGSNQIVSEPENERYEVADLTRTSVEANCDNVGTEKICQSETLLSQYVQSFALYLHKLQIKNYLLAATVQEVVNETAFLLGSCK